MDLIYNFKDLKKEDIPIAGGKGANLGELTNSKMPVPTGFVVTVRAYDDFLIENNLEKIIDENIQSGNSSGEMIRDAFIKSGIPEDIKAIVLKAYKKMGGVSVAVRSSATAEDLPGASFAGQQDTYLNIIGEEKLLDALRKTWASLWTDRAIAYRIRQKIDQKKVKIAVVIQQMVDAEFAGVMFTANPITGNRKQIVIDASPGLGEAIVSGLVTPDNFIIQQKWCKWRVLEKKEGKHEIIFKDKKGGGIKSTVESDTNIDDIPKLPKEVLFKLAKLGMKIERHFNFPQDIEWVWAKSTVFIVQSRPITALPDELQQQSKISRVLSSMFVEMMPKRPLPLEATLFGPELMVKNFVVPFLKLIGLRIQPASKFLIEKDGIFVCYNGKMRPHLTMSVVFAPFRILSSAIKHNPFNWKEDLRITETLKEIKGMEKEDYIKYTPNKLANTAKKALKKLPTILEVRIMYFPRVVIAMAFLYTMLWIVGRKDLFGILLFSGITTKVTKTNDSIADLVKEIRRNNTLVNIFLKNEPNDIYQQLKKVEIGQNFLQKFQIFLDTYGYRESGGTLLTSQPTWKESPEVVLEIIKALVNSSHHVETKDDWEEIRNTLIKKTVLHFSTIRSLFIKSLNTARLFQEIRENTRFYLMMVIPTLRKIVLELGKRLTEAKILNNPQDVFYFKFDELISVAKSLPLQGNRTNELVTLISKRKLDYNNLKNIPIVDPRLYRIEKNEDGALLVGVSGSPGVVEGIARVIHDSSEFKKLQSGDILIALYTNPSWTPLFKKATAVVVDTGGMMSHAAIVAREYGIPAVMGTVDGTIKIKDGDNIRVDGSNGKVYENNIA